MTSVATKALHRTRAMLEPDCGWREHFRRMRRRGIRVVIAAGLLSIPVLIFALVGLPHVIRGPLVRNVIAASPTGVAVNDRDFPLFFSQLTGAHLQAGHDVQVLIDGHATFAALWRDLSHARRSITVQMYYLGAGRVLDSTVALLAERSRAGVEVYFLYDAFGGKTLPKGLLDTLESAGARVAAFRPLRWYALDRANHRSHVRGFVIDGGLAYTGGFGLDDKWLGGTGTSLEWRETNVRFSGPAVSELQGAFIAKWAEATGELLLRDRLLESQARHGTQQRNVQAALLYSAPLTGSTPAERFLALSIASARRQLFVTNSYFVPQSDFVSLLTDAARRGVDVRILTNGPETDVEATRLAGHQQYETLLRSGVRIWEYGPTTVHAKTLSVDGVWSAITTMNFDNRSLAYNNEVALVARDSAVTAVLDSTFLVDLRASTEVTLAAFAQRSNYMRVREWIAGLVASIL